MSRVRVQGPRGRPAHAWMVAADARPGGQAPRAYRDVARWLARSLNARRMSLRGLEQTGREVGRELAPSGAAPSVEAIEQVLAALGFAPYVQSRDEDRMTICLGNCPIATPRQRTRRRSARCTRASRVGLSTSSLPTPGSNASYPGIPHRRDA